MAVVADTAFGAAHPGPLQQKDLEGGKADRRQAADLLGACPVASRAGAVRVSGKPAEHAAHRWRHLRDIRRDQRVLDADHRHREHLFTGILCGRGGGRVPDVVAVDQLRTAMVGAASYRHVDRPRVRRHHRSSGHAAGRLLLCSPDAGAQRAVPGLFHHLQGIRFLVGRALWRGFIHQRSVGALHPVPGGLLWGVHSSDRRAFPIPVCQRQAPRAHLAHGAGKARGLRRSNRR